MQSPKFIGQHLTSLCMVYGINPIIRELGSFVSDIYPITSSPKHLYVRTKEVSFMGYTNRRATMKWWYPQTKKLKYCSSANFYEHNNKFGKGWSPGYKLIANTNISTLPTLKLISHITPSSKMVYLKSL